MSETDKLIKQANALIDEKAYSTVITLLNEDVLNAHNSAGLFYWRARGEFGLGTFDNALNYLNKALLIDKNHAHSYNSRGLVFRRMKQYDKALQDMNKAIELVGNDPIFYFNRGIISAEIQEYDKVIEDYTKAIDLGFSGNNIYNERGVAWHWKKNHKNAISDFTKAIKLEPDNSTIYYNRGYLYILTKKYEKAIKDLKKSIDLEPDYSSSHKQLAIAYEKLNKDKPALYAFNEAIRLDPKTSTITLRDALLAKMGVPLEYDKAKADDTLYQIAIALEEIDGETKQLEILKFYKVEIEPLINDIREYSSKIDEDFWIDGTGKPQPKYVAHYSNLKVLDIIVMNESSRLRYSNAVFMNDPEEGKVLIDYLGLLEERTGEVPEIKKAFENIEKEEKTNFYIGSFLPVKDFHEDELLMWRTYGKDENSKEAAGCCLVIDAGFFDTTGSKLIALGKRLDSAPAETTHPLYKVIYCNKRKGRIEGEESNLIDEKLISLKNALRNLLKQKDDDVKLNKAIDRVIYHSLSELRFFFKSADYSYENELRVIEFATHANVVHIDKTSTTLPRKIYIESSKEIKPHLRKVILGPKVLHPERWMYIEEEMKRQDHKIEIAYSICHFQ